MTQPVAIVSEEGELVYAVPDPSKTTEQHSKDDECHHTIIIPALCFGLYKVPNDEHGEHIVLDALDNAGYRHLDSAPIYENEVTVGKAIQKSLVDRSKLFIGSKVWNDIQRQGRAVVRQSVLQSIQDLQCGGYLDICYIHWPVPGHFVETYRELQLLKNDGLIRHIGISNFTINEYQQLMGSDGITDKPLMNQFEVSPFMYRPQLIEYFQEQGIVVAASKSLHRSSTDLEESQVVATIAKFHKVSCAQVLLRWSLQKGLVPLAKTSQLARMQQNRNVQTFSLTTEEMSQLDTLTSEKDIQARMEREEESKTL